MWNVVLAQAQEAVEEAARLGSAESSPEDNPWGGVFPMLLAIVLVFLLPIFPAGLETVKWTPRRLGWLGPMAQSGGRRVRWSGRGAVLKTVA